MTTTHNRQKILAKIEEKIRSLEYLLEAWWESQWRYEGYKTGQRFGFLKLRRVKKDETLEDFKVRYRISTLSFFGFSDFYRYIPFENRIYQLESYRRQVSVADSDETAVLLTRKDYSLIFD